MFDSDTNISSYHFLIFVTLNIIKTSIRMYKSYLGDLRQFHYSTGLQFLFAESKMISIVDCTNLNHPLPQFYMCHFCQALQIKLYSCDIFCSSSFVIVQGGTDCECYLVMPISLVSQLCTFLVCH